MRRAWLACAFTLVACAQLQGLDDYQKVDCVGDCQDAATTTPATPNTPVQNTSDADASFAGEDAEAATADAGNDAPASGRYAAWSYRRALALTSDAPTGAAGETVLISLPPAFNATHAKPNGDDLRFSTTVNGAVELSYFVEKWVAGGESLVWVRVPTANGLPSEIYMFYGNPSAPAGSNFGAAFPNAQRTTGGGAGSFTANGDIQVDWFELRAGDTLTLQPGAPLQIRAKRIIIAGTIDGNGKGHAGGLLGNASGHGPGGGQVSNPIHTEGGGGGGYGGAGGRGGEDVAGSGGVGGVAYGTTNGDDVQMGSGGASSDTRSGGAGGGGISLLGWRTSVSGVIRMNGVAGEGGTDRNGGGGAGGGILIGSASLDLSGAVLTANGGPGGGCSAPAHDGGGGGAGGRIKLRSRPSESFIDAATVTASQGAGGSGANTTAPGVEGAAGSTHASQTSTLAKGITSTLGAEQAQR